jgi:hypothetical protein
MTKELLCCGRTSSAVGCGAQAVQIDVLRAQIAQVVLIQVPAAESVSAVSALAVQGRAEAIEVPVLRRQIAKSVLVQIPAGKTGWAACLASWTEQTQ